jgi:hypothetical protein
MERLEALERQIKMLSFLSGLPRRIASLHGQENVTEFVLHDLCHEQCLNLNKAAFFIDNPDFNCAKGVAGFSREEDCCGDCTAIWQDTAGFSAHRKKSSFNQRVRGLSRTSLKHGNEDHENLAQQLATDLGFTNYAFCSWPMRHANEGFMLYEKGNVADALADDHLLNGVSLLNFCPVF